MGATLPDGLVAAVVEAAGDVDGYDEWSCSELDDSPGMWLDTPDGPNDQEHRWGGYVWGYNLKTVQTWPQTLETPAEYGKEGKVWIQELDGKTVWSRGAYQLW